MTESDAREVNQTSREEVVYRLGQSRCMFKPVKGFLEKSQGRATTSPSSEKQSLQFKNIMGFPVCLFFKIIS